MKTQLLKKQIAFISVVIVMFFFSAAHAQFIYTDVIPDNVNSCTSGPVCNETYNIDLDQDGQDDFTLTLHSNPYIHIQPLTILAAAWVHVQGLNGNEVSYDGAYYALAIDSNSEIFGGTWNSSSALWLRHVYGGAFSGLWLTSVDKYLGVRLMVDTNFYYGWIRLSVTITAPAHAQCITKDFAYNSTPNQPVLAGDTSGIASGVFSLKNENHFSVFPNPSSYKITLSSSSPGKKEIQITNTLGQIVFSATIYSQQEEINLLNFPRGIYLVTVKTDSQTFEKKFLKE